MPGARRRAAGGEARPRRIPQRRHAFVPGEARGRLPPGLRELGWVEGRNVTIEYRWAAGKIERLPELAAELERMKVDVIVSAGPAVTRAAKQATTTPIVMAFDSDPVGSGFVASLARPGGNITGLSILAPEISGKQLDILKQIIPTLSRVRSWRRSPQEPDCRRCTGTRSSWMPAG